MTSPTPFVVVASPEIAPRSSGGISLKSSPHARVITVPPAIATRKMRPRYQVCHSRPRPPATRPVPYTAEATMITRASPTRSPILPATSAATMYPPATAARM